MEFAVESGEGRAVGGGFGGHDEDQIDVAASERYFACGDAAVEVEALDGGRRGEDAGGGLGGETVEARGCAGAVRGWHLWNANPYYDAAGRWRRTIR